MKCVKDKAVQKALFSTLGVDVNILIEASVLAWLSLESFGDV